MAAYKYKRFMRDGTVAEMTGTRTVKQVRTGKTKKDRERSRGQ